MDERTDFMFSRKDLQRLIIPLIVEQFLSITIGMADTLSKKGRFDLDSRTGVDLRQVMITEIGVLFVRSCSVL